MTIGGAGYWAAQQGQKNMRRGIRMVVLARTGIVVIETAAAIAAKMRKSEPKPKSEEK